MLAGKEYDAGPGDVITVPPGTAHLHPWSTSAEGLHLRQSTTLDQADFGALVKFDTMLETLFALAQEGKVNAQGQPSLLQFAVILRDIQPEGYLAGLPIWLQHALVGALARIGKLFGYKAHAPAYAPA